MLFSMLFSADSVWKLVCTASGFPLLPVIFFAVLEIFLSLLRTIVCKMEITEIHPLLTHWSKIPWTNTRDTCLLIGRFGFYDFFILWWNKFVWQSPSPPPPPPFPLPFSPLTPWLLHRETANLPPELHKLPRPGATELIQLHSSGNLCTRQPGGRRLPCQTKYSKEI